MGENFTLYRGESGRLCLTDPRCPHRGTQLSSGSVEGDDLRCFYHGWKFAPGGQCNEQPAEDSSYCDRVKLNSYPIREYLGLIFAYLGEGAAPHFPTYPEFEDFDGLIEIDSYLRACNYFQNLENALDMSHVAFVHRDNMVSYSGIGRGAQLRAEESDWGVTYTFTRDDGQLRIQQFGMPNIFYMTALPTDLGGRLAGIALLVGTDRRPRAHAIQLASRLGRGRGCATGRSASSETPRRDRSAASARRRRCATRQDRIA